MGVARGSSILDVTVSRIPLEMMGGYQTIPFFEYMLVPNTRG